MSLLAFQETWSFKETEIRCFLEKYLTVQLGTVSSTRILQKKQKRGSFLDVRIS